MTDTSTSRPVTYLFAFILEKNRGVGWEDKDKEQAEIEIKEKSEENRGKTDLENIEIDFQITVQFFVGRN